MGTPEIDLDLEDIRAVTGFATRSATPVLTAFESAAPADGRPRGAVETALTFAEGGRRNQSLRTAAIAAHRAAREVGGDERAHHAAMAAGDERAHHAAMAAGDAAASAYLHPLADAAQVGLLALWAAECAEHVLGLFEREAPDDPRPREALDATRSWTRGELPMMRSRAAGGHAMGAARPLRGAARFAAYAAGQAACVPHVAEHDLGAAAYAIKAVQAGLPEDPEAGRRERDWQRDRLPERVRRLVLEDQERRDHLCWGVFSDG